MGGLVYTPSSTLSVVSAYHSLQTNRDHLKDKELLRDKLALEKAGNQGFEKTITQFVARLEEAEQKEEAAQAGAKEAEESVNQLKKE